MSNTVKKYKRLRASLRGNLTRTENYINLQENITEEEIDSRLYTLQESLQRFHDAQREIELETEEDQLEEEIQYRYEFEELYTKLKVKLLLFRRYNNNEIENRLENIENLGSVKSYTRKECAPKIPFQPYQDTESFKNFARRLSVYLLMNNINDTRMKVYTLLSTLSPELHEKVCDLCSPEDPLDKCYEDLIKILQDYIDPKPSVWAMQHNFISRLQSHNETVTIYASELKRLSSYCEFNCQNCKQNISENFLSLQFIRGLKDGDIRIKILQEKEKLQFSELIQIAASIEMGKVDNAAMTNIPGQENNRIVNKITPSRNNVTLNKTSKRDTLTIEDLKGTCFRCGRIGHRANTCRSLHDTCYKCGRKGHLAKVCLKRRNEANQIEEQVNNKMDEDLGEINIINGEIVDKYMITVNIENRNIKMEFDTGAALSSISLNDYKKLQINRKIFKTDIKLKTYTGEIIKPIGVAYVRCYYDNQRFYGKLYIINKNVDPIFGRSWMKELQVDIANLHSIDCTDQSLKLDQLLEEYSTSVFRSDIGKIPNFQAHLNLKTNVQPICIKPRRVPYALKSKIDNEIERLCEQGIITKIDHSEWGTPIVPIVKPNGSIRLCADYKITLNKVIEDEKYPIPVIEDIFSEMNGGKIFCTLDISQAYLNMEMDEESALLQTLSTHKGIYKVNRLMFGVKVAPNLWQKFMDKILQGLEGVKCFFDDIIIQGSSEGELLQRLHQVLQRLKDNNLRVNKEKIKSETINDEELQPILQALQTGKNLRSFGYNNNELTMQDGCILKGTRVFIPKGLRDIVLNELHTGHIGVVKMKLLARSFVYWRNIDKDIENKVKSCRSCRLQLNEPKKVEIHHWEESTEPWQRIHIDFAGPIYGHYLFVIVDSYSKWVEIIPTKTITSSWCIQKLKDLFSTFGAPNILVSDNGRQFTSNEFKNFLTEQRVLHRTSAPYHPATNGQAERFVQTIKRRLKTMEQERGTLIDKIITVKCCLRRTPGVCGRSPYELMFGRNIRTYLHTIFERDTNTRVQLKENIILNKQFKEGDRVQVRVYGKNKKWIFGTIQKRLGTLHYQIVTDENEIIRRHVDQMLSAPLIERQIAAEGCHIL
ncbi:uncharacterized protein K02A2.6-like [Vanessa cardui]|uniref:uncharacterized protein K02A2.6-like n=1 Tax=Vanessa cardui TaxID=171605 RepID=UPI001F13E01E|nr:uncharacterized protein K02A2.6-like [Vanessa cardui]